MDSDSLPILYFSLSSCQFVVSEDQDYTVHFADPDTLVNWDFVEQVVSSSAKLISCSWERELKKGTVVTQQLLAGLLLIPFSAWPYCRLFPKVSLVFS